MSLLSIIQPCELPDGALLCHYQRDGAYADCYCSDMPRSVSQAEYVEAFYSTPVFKIERWLLAVLVSKPSTDSQAAELAAGRLDTFAAWRVEGRTPDQLLLSDFRGHTRSWLMSAARGPASTRLYFGSAVVPPVNRTSGKKEMGFIFQTLLGFHKLYSRVLLRAARSRLERS